ncbi:hypothetical protein O6H91_07G128500 [Diphasiastrum complanatum]|uniref:Uncharacterized protein n=1 Tax=Diphasiastrum complanatum TaxID=34168 RepID=A0ACC2D9Q9_DIPCM|nr:hypothetical protein O6H91_07G128500 [Diphasiastrum complanatum]
MVTQLREQELQVSKDARKSRCIRKQEDYDGSELAAAESSENRRDWKRAKACVGNRLPRPMASTLCHELEGSSPLGLTLRKTPSFLELVSLSLNRSCGRSGLLFPTPDAGAQENEQCRAGGFSKTAFSTKDKLKASNFPASVLKIGAWERSSRYEGDVVAKCYYAKQKLVWEILEDGLKNKIEVQWSEISAIKASFPENQPGMLEIEVSRPPLFFRETNPRPRKHTMWHATTDFTRGEAIICKRHLLWFAEGILNKHYEKLLQCDSRLKAIATVEDSAVFLRNRYTATIEEESQGPCSELDYPISISSHSSLLGSALEHNKESSPPSDVTPKLYPGPSVLTSSPGSVNDTWTTEQNHGSDNNDYDIMEDIVVHFNDGASVDSGDSLDNMTELGKFLLSGGISSSECHMLDEITHMILGEPFNLSPEEGMSLSANLCATSAMLDEDANSLPPWMPKSYSLLDGLSVAEISCNVSESYQRHVWASVNSSMADVKPSKKDLTDESSSNNFMFDP